MKEWLQKQIDKFDPTDSNQTYDNIIILTHHAPTFKLLNISDLYSPCYGTDCENLMGPPVSHWISGHTHAVKSVTINDTQCMSNCMGYPSQKVNGFDQLKYINFE